MGLHNDERHLALALDEIEDAGWTLGAIYHSHTRSAPQPSQTDINMAVFGDAREPVWPGSLYIIVGVVELLAAIALLVPRLTRIGAGALTIIMVGAAATHLIHREPQVVTAVVLIALLSIIFYLPTRTIELGVFPASI